MSDICKVSDECDVSGTNDVRDECDVSNTHQVHTLLFDVMWLIWVTPAMWVMQVKWAMYVKWVMLFDIRDACDMIDASHVWCKTF